MEEKIEEDVIITTVPATSVGMSGNERNALGTLQNALYPVCSLHIVDFPMLFEEKKSGRHVLKTSVVFGLADLEYSSSRVLESEMSTTTSSLHLKRRPCRILTVRNMPRSAGAHSLQHFDVSNVVQSKFERHRGAGAGRNCSMWF